MTPQFRILLFVLISFTLVVLINQIRKKKLELQYTLTWLFLLCILLIVTAFPKLLFDTTRMFGIELPINMIFFLGFVFTLLIVYRLTVAISKQSKEITSLTQEVALLKKKLEEKDS